MKNTKILVLGSNGKTGRRVVERLEKIENIEIRLGSRNEKIPFDWEKPETWEKVLQDIDAAYITFQPDLAIPSAADSIQNFTLLATKAGVQKIVLLSGRGEKEAQVCEEIVKTNAKNWIIVRASWFNQNFSESIFLDPILAGIVALPRAEALEPFVDADDIADVVTASLLDEKHNGQTYELTGPRLLTFEQIVNEIANATNRNITFQPLSLSEYVQMLREYQIPEDFIWLVNYLFEQVLDGRNSSVTSDIEKVLGRKAKDFSAYAKETAETGIWDI
ncbi:NAD(P)H azoreductase [Flavobacterium bizetiae]|uniref:NAD(P)H azoreductase n=1 Tax=Flavobacterium bizetiae TaxID=2704140 RepID=A0A6J4G797_9FLAO|nr:NmrA family transcriptional regulator [Flavobacterium bizetiae]CAA9194238.1 NAD(P)H azoreductase [Flavobacterium bizetiae]CAD5340407.1 NAD(P)H azoreductase [Flavobacterium bizetiae]CAD5346809.1 NAD(P)H azoreductase [Flavobacterium bizetiae]